MIPTVIGAHLFRIYLGVLATGKELIFLRYGVASNRTGDRAAACAACGRTDYSVPRPSHRSVRPRRRAREIDFYATVEVAV